MRGGCSWLQLGGRLRGSGLLILPSPRARARFKEAKCSSACGLRDGNSSLSTRTALSACRRMKGWRRRHPCAGFMRFMRRLHAPHAPALCAGCASCASCAGFMRRLHAPHAPASCAGHAIHAPASCAGFTRFMRRLHSLHAPASAQERPPHVHKYVARGITAQ